jgi:hypothetical protein
VTKKWDGLHSGHFFSRTHPVTLIAALRDAGRQRRVNKICYKLEKGWGLRKQTVAPFSRTFHNQGDQGPMLWFSKIFSPKNLAKKLHFLLKLLLVFGKNLIITLIFGKNHQFFTQKIGEKSQKIVIITSTPDWANFRPIGDRLLYIGRFCYLLWL